MTAQPRLFERPEPPRRQQPERVAAPPASDRRDVMALIVPATGPIRTLRHYAVTPAQSVADVIDQIGEVPRAMRAAADGSPDPILVDASARTRAVFAGVTLAELRAALQFLKG